QHAELEEKLEGWLAHALRVEAFLLSTTEKLERSGIDHRVFKGVALANTVYDDPSLRVFADVDVLVPSSDFADAARLLDATPGTHRALPELRPGFDTRFGREAMLRSETGLELDVHRTFVDGAYGLTVELDDLFVKPRVFALGGRAGTLQHFRPRTSSSARATRRHSVIGRRAWRPTATSSS